MWFGRWLVNARDEAGELSRCRIAKLIAKSTIVGVGPGHSSACAERGRRGWCSGMWEVGKLSTHEQGPLMSGTPPTPRVFGVSSENGIRKRWEIAPCALLALVCTVFQPTKLGVFGALQHLQGRDSRGQLPPACGDNTVPDLTKTLSQVAHPRSGRPFLLLTTYPRMV